MIDYKKEAMEIKDEIIANRRQIHANPELGLDLPKTVEFVMEKLRSYGYDPQPCGRGGVVAMAGQGGKVMLLRGDMDALPMYEETGLPFASKVEACHSCGHDMHAAMLLGAARLLKAHESELKGRVKFMFQPGEEILGGAEEMIKNGLMENPKVDVAMGMHIRGAMMLARFITLTVIPLFRVTTCGSMSSASRPTALPPTAGWTRSISRRISLSRYRIFLRGRFRRWSRA